MKVTEHLQRSKSTLFSFEILPPLKGESINSIFNAIEQLTEFKPAFIDVTYHREEYVYKERENGFLEKISIRKRPGTVGICSAITNKYQIDTVPHIICGGFSVEETENALIDLSFLGIDNVLIIRGDPIKSESSFTPEPKGHKYAIDLLKQVNNMNNGKYLFDEVEDIQSTNFCIGVAGYPEKHYEAPNLQSDLMYLKEKVNSGANYIVTQMFYDNQKFYDFVNLCRKEGINVPIIPGIKPITTKQQLINLPKIFHIDIPEALASEVRKCEKDSQVRQIGIEWAIQQSKDLIKFGAPCLHYYTMGKSKTTYQIASKVF
jgi:methylenetetrahydrofolate reductase (NADPH)